jgi:precorrin isomerase
MASPVCERAPAGVEVVVVPGVTAAVAAAALLGGPLGHDHCAISLSDLLTPWEAILARVKAAAAGDLVVSFYNPRSRERHWQLDQARAALLAERRPDTPVGVVTDAFRPGQRVELTTLADLDVASVGMRTIVVVGNSRTRVVLPRRRLRGGAQVKRTVHPIEAESYRRLRALVDLAGLPPLSRAVIERVVHASADLDYVRDLVLDEAALERGLAALRAGRPVVADSRMVAAGITARPVRCGLGEARLDAFAAGRALTRSAAGMLLAVQDAGPGAVLVVGNAPTALAAVLDAGAEPAFVVGLPVGFVGAVEAKQALRDAGLPAVSNRGPKGGSAVAAAALNALLYVEDP